MIDKRKHYVLVVDTETANTHVSEDGKMDMSDVLVYDCGWAVVDTKGNIYETASYVNRDIFVDERAMMQSAYYGWKIPRYIEEIRNGQRIMANTYEIRKAMLDTIEKYNIKEVAAHNARFDYNALNVTQRWTTCSKYRYWFPYGEIEMWDTMKMAQDVICNMPTYRKFCEENEYITASGRLKKTAEILYRFISGNTEFEESHTGLEDVLIEAQIMFYCYRQHKPMRKALFSSPPLSSSTSFQKELSASLKQVPCIRWAAEQPPTFFYGRPATGCGGPNF